MKLSINLPASLLRSLSVGKAMMLKRLSIFALVLAGCAVSVTQADATFTYELSGSDDKKTVKQFSIARFFVRIDDPGEAKKFLLFQAGRFFPMYAVDEAESTYTLLTPPANPRLGPVSRSQPVAQVTTGKKEDEQADQKNADNGSQPPASAAQPGTEDTAEAKPETVAAESTESEDGAAIKQETSPPKPAAQPEAAVAESDGDFGRTDRQRGITCHIRCAERALAGTRPSKRRKRHATSPGFAAGWCTSCSMASQSWNTAWPTAPRLGVTDREVITLSRLFAMARKMGFDWLGVGTKDEEFVAVQSRDLRDNRLLQLTSVSTKPLPAGYLRIPRTYKQIESDAQSDSGTTGEVAD